MKKTIFSLLSIVILLIVVSCTPSSGEELNKFTVTFDSVNGSEVITQEVEKNGFATLPTPPTKENHSFEGWFKDSRYSEEWKFSIDKVTKNITLYAKWELDPQVINHEVVFNTNGGNTMEKVSVEEDSTLSVPNAPTKANKMFAGWFKDENFSMPWNFGDDKVNNNTTLYAKWKQPTDFNESFKILSVGNSFSEDAHRYLYEIAKSFGIPEDKIIIANMYIGGAELVKQYNNANNSAKLYQYQVYKNGERTNTNNFSLDQAMMDESWDVITFQQASHHSGVEEEYKDYLLRLTRWVDSLTLNPDVQIAWHMTWAYQQTSNHSGFANYNNNQQTMFDMIVSTQEHKVKTVTQVQYVIPSGTAIQNARTSYIGDRLTQDGYHLTQPLGRYIAGLMFFKKITGFDVSSETIEYMPEGVRETDQLMAIEAVNNAYNKPLEVTNSTYTEAPPKEPIITTGEQIDYNIIPGYWNDNATAVTNAGTSFDLGFAATVPINKGMLPVGSEIVIEPGFKYRVVFLEKQGEGFKVVNRTENSQVPLTNVDEDFWGNYKYVAFNVSRDTGGVIDIEADKIKENFRIYHPEGTGSGHVDGDLEWNLGTYELNSTALVNVNHSFATTPLTPGYFVLNNVVNVTPGYKFAVVTFSFDGEYKVLSVSPFKTDELVMDESFREDKDLVGFIVTKDSSTDISSEDVKDLIYIGPPALAHVDEPLNFVSGYWADNQTKILNAGQPFDLGFAASNITSKSGLGTDNTLTVESGFQVRVVFLSYDGYGGYKVLYRTANLTGTINIGLLWENYEYIAYNISSVPSSDLSGMLADLPSKLTYSYVEPPEEIPHIDKPLSFVSGYYELSKTEITNKGNPFDLGFAASNVLSKASLEQYSDIEIAAGYKVRVIFFTYDMHGTYTVKKRTELIAGPFVMDELFWENYEFLGFTMAASSSTDLSGVLSSLPSKVKFLKPLVEHVDEPLSFVSGYWNDNKTEITNTGNAFDLGFAASNIISKDSMSASNKVVVEAGYQIRVIFLSYDGRGTYKVLHRTDNLTGEIELYKLWSGYDFIAYNISTTPSSNLSTVLADLPGKLTFSFVEQDALVPHVDQPLTFVSGYYEVNKTAITNTGNSLSLSFAASNVLSKASLLEYSKLEVAAGYKIRVIFFTYNEYGTYTVKKRTDLLAGQFVMDDSFWERYEYLGFSIQADPSSDLSGVLADLPTKITFLEP